VTRANHRTTSNCHNRHIGLPLPDFLQAIKRPSLGCSRWEVLGKVMVAKKSSEKLKTELFDDLPVLQRKWQAAVRPGERLPRYEDVMLGSLGRLADHIVLLKNDRGAIEVSRSGRYVQQWLNDERWDIPLGALSPDCATALGESAANALTTGR